MNDAAMDHAEIKHRTATSVLWSIMRVGWASAISFITFALLARLLTPSLFGVYALATALVEVTKLIAGAGLSDAIIRERTVDEETASTAFWANLALGVLVGALVAAAAGSYAALTHQPPIAPVLYALAPLVPISSLGGIHTARKLKAFGHKTVAVRTMAANTLAGGAAVVAAFAGYGVWSLVIQAAIADVVGVMFAWGSFPWLPRLVFSWRRLRALFSFSLGMMVTQLLWLLLARTPDVLIGRYWGAAAVGTFRIALRMIDLISQAVLAPIGGVALVTLARLQDDDQKFGNAYVRMVGVVGLFTLPAILGFGAVSTEAIHVLFGAKWDASGPIAAVLSLMAVPLTLNSFAAPALAAKGRSRVVLQLATVQIVLTVAALFVAAPYGLMAITAAYVLRTFITMPYAQWVLSRYAQIPVASAARALWGPLFASGAMVLAVMGAKWAGGSLLRSDVARLAIEVILGGLAYAAGLAIFARPLISSHGQALAPVARRLIGRVSQTSSGSR